MLDKNDLERIFSEVEIAGEKVSALYNKDYHIETKKDKSKVTEADYASNRHLVGYLEKNFTYPIISEENKNETLGLGKTWVIDPIDGTQDFIEKTGDFSIMLALLEKQEVVFSLVYLPLEKTFYYAQKHQGSFKRKGDQEVRLDATVPATKTPMEKKESIVMFISRSHFTSLEKKISENVGIDQLIKMGSIGIKISKIAEGLGNAYINISSSLGIWDLAPPYLILEEAGGDLMDLRGEKISFNSPDFKIKNGCIATSRKEISTHLLQSYNKYKTKEL